MEKRSRIGAARFAAALAGAVVAVTVPVALAADSSGLRAEASGLRAQAGSLDARARAATLELYSLQTRLGAAQAELERLGVRRAELARERRAAQQQLEIARRAAVASERRLGELVRALYEQPGQADPLAILLGATTLEEALAGFDNLDRAADETARIVEQTVSSRTRLGQVGAELARRDAELAQLLTAVQGRTAQLAAAAAEREAYVAGLRREQGLTARRVAAIEAEAAAAEARTVTLSRPVRSARVEEESSANGTAPAPAPAPAAEPAAADAPAVEGGRTITVSATAYALRGRTATGIQTAPGVVAVDPSFIPLGTRMYIPGYGEGVAADTGGAVQGAIIDVWFPTRAQALAWGRRTVTITIR